MQSGTPKLPSIPNILPLYYLESLRYFSLPFFCSVFSFHFVLLVVLLQLSKLEVPQLNFL